jgi:hypothetical protein
MTYREALKFFARALPLAPFDREIWQAIREHAGVLAYDVSNIVLRLVALSLYPIAVPVFAAVLMKNVRAHEQALAKALRESGFE